MVWEVSGWQGVVVVLQLVDGGIVIRVWSGSEGQASVVLGLKQQFSLHSACHSQYRAS